MSRTAQYEHQCSKCRATIRAYRNCQGEEHIACLEVKGSQINCGRLILTQEYDYEEAKKAGMTAKWATRDELIREARGKA